MAGRPTKLTDELRAAIARDLAAGLPRNAAAARAGITFSTFALWMARGRKRTRAAAAFFEFSEAVKRAEADAVARAVVAIQAAGRDTWQAYAWWLERKYPEDWSAARAEVADLRRQVRDLLAAVRGLTHADHPPAPAAAPPRPNGRRPARTRRG